MSQICAKSFVVISFLCIAKVTFGEYNLVDTNPSCYTKGLCTAYGKPGTGINSIHPNAEERIQYAMRNMARLYPNDYIKSKYGKYQFGTFGDQTVYHDEDPCGVATERPMYWHSDGNQLARWHQWDADNCDGINIGHDTCEKRCYLFKDADNDDPCSFGARADIFVGDDGAYAASEGLWGANMGYEDGHCGAVFNPDYTYQGIGFWPFTNGVAAVFIQNGPEINYPLVQGAHFDETIKINRADYNDDDKHLTFVVEYYGRDVGNKEVDTMYLLYDGAVHSMDLIFGDKLSGFYELHFDIPEQCKPYAFFAVTEDDTTYRLPQSVNYFFGTAWSEWDWWSPDDDCKENHYYYNGDKWIPNGSPQVENNDNCVGCEEIDVLVDIYQDFDNPDTTIDIDITMTPTQMPTNKPTYKPTDKPTLEPTEKPTLEPTDKPTAEPNYGPTFKPTPKPTDKPFVTPMPTDKPTEKPTDKISPMPTEKPTEKIVTPMPTNKPTDRPTYNPTTDIVSDDESYFDCRSQACGGLEMRCSSKNHCYIDCSYEEEACQDAVVYCPQSFEYECIIECNGKEACDRLKIYGESSKILTVACGNYDESCFDMDIYCPINNRNSETNHPGYKWIPTCFISGHNDFEGMRIFAKYGFLDVDIDVSESLESTVMYCNDGYKDSCEIMEHEPNNRCEHNEDVCYAAKPPTNRPTRNPTSKPIEDDSNDSNNDSYDVVIQPQASHFDCRSESCVDQILICVNNEDCYIDCGYSGGEACQNTIIHCPIDAKCILFCDGFEGCERVNVFAQESNAFYLICENHEEVCHGMNIYCPHNDERSCDISGYSNFIGTNFYTLYGFDNLIFNVEDGLPGTTLYCGDKYTSSCGIDNEPPYDKCTGGTDNTCVAGNDDNSVDDDSVVDDNSDDEEEPTPSPTKRRKKGRKNYRNIYNEEVSFDDYLSDSGSNE